MRGSSHPVRENVTVCPNTCADLCNGLWATFFTRWNFPRFGSVWTAFTLRSRREGSTIVDAGRKVGRCKGLRVAPDSG